MPVIVHHLNDSRSQRILWLLEELNVPYEIKHYQRGPDRRAPKELRDVHPLGKSPVITTESGRVIAESGAIVDYLIKEYSKDGAAKPTNEDGRLDDSFWSHFAEGSLMPSLVMKLIFGIIPTQAPFLVRPIASAICSGVVSSFVDPEVAKLMKFIGDELAKKQSAAGPGKMAWFAGGDAAGNPTAADFAMLFPLEAVTAGGRSPKGVQIDGIKQWVDEVHKRPAYQRALEKGGKYSYA